MVLDDFLDDSGRIDTTRAVDVIEILLNCNEDLHEMAVDESFETDHVIYHALLCEAMAQSNTIVDSEKVYDWVSRYRLTSEYLEVYRQVAEWRRGAIEWLDGIVKHKEEE